MALRLHAPILLASILATLALVAVACGGTDETNGSAGAEAGPAATSDPATTEPTTAPSELGTGDGTFTMRTETFVDGSRSTADQPGRTLRTDIYLPGGEGPFPLVVFAHGMDGATDKFTQLLGSWAQAGYIVVAPNFPRTNRDTPPELRDVGDYRDQPADVEYALDQVLAMDEPGGELDGMIATDHMGIAGLSLGGATTYPLLFHPCCRDERFRSAIIMSGLQLPFGGDFERSDDLPVLAFAGTADTSVRYELQQETIATLPGPTWFVTLEGGLHAPPFENTTAPHDQLVLDSTRTFWDATLRHEPEDPAAASDAILAAATVDGLSTAEYRP